MSGCDHTGETLVRTNGDRKEICTSGKASITRGWGCKGAYRDVFDPKIPTYIYNNELPKSKLFHWHLSKIHPKVTLALWSFLCFKRSTSKGCSRCTGLRPCCLCWRNTPSSHSRPEQAGKFLEKHFKKFTLRKAFQEIHPAFRVLRHNELQRANYIYMYMYTYVYIYVKTHQRVTLAFYAFYSILFF